MLQYFQFPKFLLKLRISQTAKFLYMILYDRARISRKNNWIDKYGNVYLINDSKRLGVEVSLKSEIIDVDGFPFKAFVGDNVNILIDERIQSHLSEESQ